MKYFTVGPSNLYHTIPKHINTAINKGILSHSHRGRKFKEIYSKAESGLRKILAIPAENKIFFISSATEAMEIILRSCVVKKSFHFVNGVFSEKFFLLGKEIKKEPAKIEVSWRSDFDYNSIKIPKDCELICFTQNETSTGVALNIKNVYKLKRQKPHALLAVDITSSVPYAKINYKLADLVFFSVQKGFGLPAGLGILIVGPRAIKKCQYLADNNFDIGGFHNLLDLKKKGEEKQTVETPNVLNIYLLGKVCADLNTRGIKKIRKEIEERAKYIYSFFEKRKGFKNFVQKKSIRSKTIITINIEGGSENLINEMKKSGYLLSPGYGQLKKEQIRLPNFPSTDTREMKQLLKMIARNVI
ncbi:MAG: aminotransferase class V-fold PLP-dependent enzyme [Candidatus Magasanikbacteria bacterium]|nr:aminotransferase class V-fold PLP-dependent enzyme [Candidatus Magasanikbacteria bacterium]